MERSAWGGGWTAALPRGLATFEPHVHVWTSLRGDDPTASIYIRKRSLVDGSEGRVRRFAAPRESDSRSHPGDFARAVWRKSSWSTWNGNCVEVAALPVGAVAVRDTKAEGRGPVLVFGADAWTEFLSQLKSGGRRI